MLVRLGNSDEVGIAERSDICFTSLTITFFLPFGIRHYPGIYGVIQILRFVQKTANFTPDEVKQFL